ncbi:MAG: hypothetical protein HYT37_00340 [Candidatus Sungbacteria bacterium]|nr:hypothetical protein [Candidatus Sungbacteria bacterium]
MRSVGVSLALVFMLFFRMYSEVFSYDRAMDDVLSCKGDLEAFLRKHLDPLKENFEPAEYRVQIADITPPKVEIYARSLPDAYLIGFDPSSGMPPLGFLTAESKAVLAARAFEPILTLSCPFPYPKDFFASTEAAAAMQFPLRFIQFFWGFQKDTPEVKRFIDRFDALLEPRLVALTRKGAVDGKFLRHAFSIFDKYTDNGFGTLRITVDVFALVWNGDGSKHKKMLEDLDNGVHRADKRMRFEALLDMRKKRSHEEIEKDVERAAYDLADSAYLYIEGVLRASGARQ